MEFSQDSGPENKQTGSIFENNVLYLKSLIGKSVLIETCDKKEHRGTLYVTDPAYNTTVLVLELNDEIEFILPGAIKSLKVLSETVREEYLEKPEAVLEISEEILARKETLKKYFENMHIPVEEHKEFLVVQEHVKIEPPYLKNNCICDNPLVLQRITQLLDAM